MSNCIKTNHPFIRIEDENMDEVRKMFERGNQSDNIQDWEKALALECFIKGNYVYAPFTTHREMRGYRKLLSKYGTLLHPWYQDEFDGYVRWYRWGKADDNVQ